MNGGKSINQVTIASLCWMFILCPHVTLQGFRTSLMKRFAQTGHCFFHCSSFGETELEAKCNNWQEEKKVGGLVLKPVSVLIFSVFYENWFFRLNWALLQSIQTWMSSDFEQGVSLRKAPPSQNLLSGVMRRET